MNALPKNGGSTVVEVSLRNAETAEMLKDMLVEQCGAAIADTRIKRYPDGWILHICVIDVKKYDVIGRIYVVLSANGVIAEREVLPVVMVH